MAYLVCLDHVDCQNVLWIEQEPTIGACEDCGGPAVWYTDYYFLTYKKRFSFSPTESDELEDLNYHHPR